MTRTVAGATARALRPALPALGQRADAAARRGVRFALRRVATGGDETLAEAVRDFWRQHRGSAVADYRGVLTDGDVEAVRTRLRVLRAAAGHRSVRRGLQEWSAILDDRHPLELDVDALARALVRKPRLLLLDDATAAVDPRVEQQILSGLRTELDMTTVVVAHRVSTIALADRVLFLDDGRVAALGTHEHLLDSVPAYAALVRAYEQLDEEVDPELDDPELDDPELDDDALEQAPR